MNADIGTEAAQFPEKEYINGIFVAVRAQARIYIDLIGTGVQDRTGYKLYSAQAHRALNWTKTERTLLG
jgi:hypothetical protein